MIEVQFSTVTMWCNRKDSLNITISMMTKVHLKYVPTNIIVYSHVITAVLDIDVMTIILFYPGVITIVMI